MSLLPARRVGSALGFLMVFLGTSIASAQYVSSGYIYVTPGYSYSAPVYYVVPAPVTAPNAGVPPAVANPPAPVAAPATGTAETVDRLLRPASFIPAQVPPPPPRNRRPHPTMLRRPPPTMLRRPPLPVLRSIEHPSRTRCLPRVNPRRPGPIQVQNASRSRLRTRPWSPSC